MSYAGNFYKYATIFSMGIKTERRLLETTFD